MRVVAPSPGTQPPFGPNSACRARRPRAERAARRRHLRATAVALAEILESAGQIAVDEVIDRVLSSAARSHGTTEVAALGAGEERTDEHVVGDAVANGNADDADDAGPESDGEKLDIIAQEGAQNDGGTDTLERTNRKRVYDAIKVMCAVGVAKRASKSLLVWNGRGHILPRVKRPRGEDLRPFPALASSRNTASAQQQDITKSKAASRCSAELEGYESGPHQTKCAVQALSCSKQAMTMCTETPGDLSDTSSNGSESDLLSYANDDSDELNLDADLAFYTSNSAFPGLDANVSRESSPGRGDSLLGEESIEKLRATVQKKRMRRVTLSSRVDALQSLSHDRKGVQHSDRSLRAPFVLVRGRFESMKLSEDARLLSIAFRARNLDEAVFSETDVACLLRRRTEK